MEKNNKCNSYFCNLVDRNTISEIYSESEFKWKSFSQQRIGLIFWVRGATWFYFHKVPMKVTKKHWLSNEMAILDLPEPVGFFILFLSRRIFFRHLPFPLGGGIYFIWTTMMPTPLSHLFRRLSPLSEGFYLVLTMVAATLFLSSIMIFIWGVHLFCWVDLHQILW